MKEVVGVEARFLKMEVVGICEGQWIWLLTFGIPRKMCLCTPINYNKNCGVSVRFIIVTYELDGHELDLI